MNLIKNTTGVGSAEYVRQDLDTIQRTINQILAQIDAPVTPTPVVKAVISSANKVTTGTDVDAVDPPPFDDGNSGTALTINWATSRVHLFTLTNNCTLTLTNFSEGGKYGVVIDTGAGAFTTTWPGTVLWPSGTAPDTTPASKKVLITLLYLKKYASYIGSFNGPY